MIEEYQARTRPADVLVLPENWPIVQAFLTVQTQIRATGFRYEGVRAGLRMAGIRCTPDLFRGLQHMEAAIVEAAGEARRAKVKRP